MNLESRLKKLEALVPENRSAGAGKRLLEQIKAVSERMGEDCDVTSCSPIELLAYRLKGYSSPDMEARIAEIAQGDDQVAKLFQNREVFNVPE